MDVFLLNIDAIGILVGLLIVAPTLIKIIKHYSN